MGAGGEGRVESAENSNVRGGGEVVSLSVMEGAGHRHTNNTCSQKLDTCHQMSSLSIIPIPDKPQASCSYDYTIAGSSSAAIHNWCRRKAGCKIFFLFFNLMFKRMKGGEDDPYLSRKSWWCSHIWQVLIKSSSETSPAAVWRTLHINHWGDQGTRHPPSQRIQLFNCPALRFLIGYLDPLLARENTRADKKKSFAASLLHDK